MSLVEATIIVMVMALLTAVIAPSIGGYVADARGSAAKADVEEIASALSRMLTDTGESWFLVDGNGAAATNVPVRTAAQRVDMLVSNGTIPQLNATARSSGTDWDDAVNHAAIQSLDNYLILNMPSNTADNAYRDAADMSVTTQFDPDDGATFNAEHAWRGAYLSGPIGPDPWAERYAVNVEFLARTQGTVGSGSRMDVIVISAGANSRIDTPFEIDGQTPGADDIIAVVSGGTR
jgi:type II secretory pathway pseudopilin PulG